MQCHFRMLAVLAAALCGGCGNGAEQSLEEDNGVRLGIVGQAIIEHDPRAYFDTPLSSIVPLLDVTDAVFTNLEVAIAGPGCLCVPTRTGVYFHGTEPDVLDYLEEIGVALLALSNNHAWDYGTEGILSTIAEVEARGMVHAGTGVDIGEATAPAYLDLHGFRLALVSMATTNLPEEAAATDSRPGVNVLNPGDSSAWDRNLAAIRSAAASADGVLVYQHFQTDAVEGWQERWARAAIDAGADIFVSHGEPELAGVEIYGGGLILFGLGNFIFHTRTELGRYPPEVWESVLVEVWLDTEGVHDVTFTPVVLDPGTPGENFLETRGYPEVAEAGRAASILARLLDLSRPYGTSFEVEGGRATLRVDDAG